MRDSSAATYQNWHEGVHFNGRSDDFIEGHRYGQYDYAQMWLKDAPRSWHDINGNEVVPETNPAVGEWVSIPNHGVILSGAFPAHALFEFPHAEFEVLQGYDLNENGLCDHTEDRECLDVFSDVALAQDGAGNLTLQLNGYGEYDPARMYLMGFGTYTLFDVPAETPSPCWVSIRSTSR